MREGKRNACKGLVILICHGIYVRQEEMLILENSEGHWKCGLSWIHEFWGDGDPRILELGFQSKCLMLWNIYNINLLKSLASNMVNLLCFSLKSWKCPCVLWSQTGLQDFKSECLIGCRNLHVSEILHLCFIKYLTSEKLDFVSVFLSKMACGPCFNLFPSEEFFFFLAYLPLCKRSLLFILTFNMAY